jgi:hypothetical protein
MTHYHWFSIFMLRNEKFKKVQQSFAYIYPFIYPNLKTKEPTSESIFITFVLESFNTLCLHISKLVKVKQ